jgi:hypothetical protein
VLDVEVKVILVDNWVVWYRPEPALAADESAFLASLADSAKAIA